MTIKKEEVVSLGIVLKTHPYKESDSLVTVYFKDYGKMTLIARGVKKLKSKNASACQSLTLSEFTFIPRNGLSTMIKASSVDFYRYIKENLELEAYASSLIPFSCKYPKNKSRVSFQRGSLSGIPYSPIKPWNLFCLIHSTNGFTRSIPFSR